MSALDSIMQWLSPKGGDNYVQGQAQLRTPGHPTAFILPQDKYDSAISTFGGGNRGATVEKPSAFAGMMSLISPTNRAIYQAGEKGPAVVLPRNFRPGDLQHEATHAVLADAKLPDPAAVNALMPPEGRDSLARAGYGLPADMAEEVPARAMTDPRTMMLDADGNGQHSAPVVRAQYLNMLQQTDPAKAAVLRKMWAMQGAGAMQ